MHKCFITQPSIKTFNFVFKNLLYHLTKHTGVYKNTVVPLMRDHKESPQKTVSQKVLPYLVGNQEVTPKALVPDYPPNKANPF